MNKSKLEMEFLDESNKKFVISIDEPRADLTPSEVRTAMEAIVGYNIFDSSMNNLAAVKDARIITTTVDDLEI